MEFIWYNNGNVPEQCEQIRRRVFVEEQQFSPDLEFDETDKIAYHLSVVDNSKPIAAARMFFENGEIHCGRICVLKEHRKGGIGLKIMNEIERKALELGCHALYLSAQLTAVPFYEKSGFISYGDSYFDEHCPHISMKKTF